mmetsp:Transcript_8704/g.25072  ORF Transcript_8704/g.25072 Transcript_8704/m.25072 type:complete len:252 (-) Transcript_8704:1133-1888(-)
MKAGGSIHGHQGRQSNTLSSFLMLVPVTTRSGTFSPPPLSQLLLGTALTPSELGRKGKGFAWVLGDGHSSQLMPPTPVELGRAPRGEALGVGRSLMVLLTMRALIRPSWLGVCRSPMHCRSLGEGSAIKLSLPCSGVASRSESIAPLGGMHTGSPLDVGMAWWSSSLLALLLESSPVTMGRALFSGMVMERSRLKRELSLLLEAFLFPPELQLMPDSPPLCVGLPYSSSPVLTPKFSIICRPCSIWLMSTA